MHHIGKIARHDGQHEGKEKALHQPAPKVVPHLLLIGLSRGTDDQLAECEGSIARLHHISVEPDDIRSEEHTSELQSLMRISYAVFCLKKKKTISSTK